MSLSTLAIMMVLEKNSAKPARMASVLEKPKALVMTKPMVPIVSRRDKAVSTTDLPSFLTTPALSSSQMMNSSRAMTISEKVSNASLALTMPKTEGPTKMPVRI